ncbi:hypothetical protein G7054_g12040 [Neopestalotiopsis clavispora]|nr:hypothetical protein G7054_g12040 [Neopestalotiopsis clavispora]
MANLDMDILMGAGATTERMRQVLTEASQRGVSHRSLCVKSRAHLEVSVKDDRFEAFGRTTNSSLLTSDDNVPAEHGWPTELEQTRRDWTEAFKGMPLRDTMGQPSKLVQIQTSDKVRPEQPVQFTVVRPKQPVQYAAVSYAWSQWGDIKDMLCRLRSMIEAAGLEYCWIDQLCIDQESDDDKEAEVRRMGDYYAQAAITYVMVPEWSPTFTSKLEVWRKRKRDGRTLVRVESRDAHGASSIPLEATHLLRDRAILDTSRAKTEYKYLDDVWSMSGERQCKEEEDRVYGMLGLVRGGGEVIVEYGIGFEEAVMRAAAKGLVSSGVLLAEWHSQKPGRCWCPASGKETRFKKTEWRWDIIRPRQPIQLTEEGRCMVRAVDFQMPGKPGMPNWFYPTSYRIPGNPNRWETRLICKNKEVEGSLNLMFDCDIPEGEEWRGDWLAVVEVEDGRIGHRATLIKYEISEGGRMNKLRALEVCIWGLDEKHIEEFLLG